MACSGATSDFQPLRDALAVQAALHGCYAGFPGRMLDVSLLLPDPIAFFGLRHHGMLFKGCTTMQSSDS